jgi:hypothetical protein
MTCIVDGCKKKAVFFEAKNIRDRSSLEGLSEEKTFSDWTYLTTEVDTILACPIKSYELVIWRRAVLLLQEKLRNEATHCPRHAQRNMIHTSDRPCVASYCKVFAEYNFVGFTKPAVCWKHKTGEMCRSSLLRKRFMPY